jgi:hypothetical protein
MNGTIFFGKTSVNICYIAVVDYQNRFPEFNPFCPRENKGICFSVERYINIPAFEFVNLDKQLAS